MGTDYKKDWNMRVSKALANGDVVEAEKLAQEYVDKLFSEDEYYINIRKRWESIVAKYERNNNKLNLSNYCFPFGEA